MSVTDEEHAEAAWGVVTGAAARIGPRNKATGIEWLLALITTIRRDERERAAKVARSMDPMTGHLSGHGDKSWPGCRECIAVAILAGGAS